MTSLGALLNWLTAGRELSAAGGNDGSDYRLRSLPREEIYVWVKAIDNTKVARLVDKKDWAASAQMAGGVMVASLLLIALLLPGGYDILASHRMEQMKKENQRLVNVLRDLRATETALKSPDMLDEYGGDRFVAPTAAAVIYAPPAKGTVASLDRR